MGLGQHWMGRECVNDVISVCDGFEGILQLIILTLCCRAKVGK